MKRYMVTRCEQDPDTRGAPSSISSAFDTIEQAEAHIKDRNPDYHYQIYEGVCSYNRYVELRKTPIFNI
jgi:hypothetical protein